MQELLALRKLCNQVRRMRMTPPVDNDFGEVMDDMCNAHDLATQLLGSDNFEFDLVTHLDRQREWSEKTFGPGDRTEGVLDHICKELAEVKNDPDDIYEWVDIVLLALDGAWRAGYTSTDIALAIDNKQKKNERRQWPDWKTSEPGKAIEHIK